MPSFRTKTLRLAALLLSTLMLAPAPAAPDRMGRPAPEDEVVLETRQVRPDLYVLIGAGGNVVVNKTSGGSVVVDTKYQGKNVYDAMVRSLREVGAVPVKYVIVTHYHPDHSGNSGAFRADGAEIVGHAGVVSLLPRTSPRETDVPAPVAPTITFDSTHTLTLGDTVVQTLYFGPGHTSADAVVFFPKLKAVVAGDLVVAGITPIIDYAGGGSVRGLQHILAEIAKLDFEICIPGHGGPTMTRTDLLDFKRRWDLFADRAHDLVRAGTPKDQFIKQLKVDDLGFDFTTFNWPNRLDGLYAELSKS